jgi:hypothetical protein
MLVERRKERIRRGFCVRNSTLARQPDPQRLAELQTWYVELMRPKLARAATAGAILPAEAAALDRDMRGLLELSREDDA